MGKNRFLRPQIDGAGCVEFEYPGKEAVGTGKLAAVEADLAQCPQGAHQHPAGQAVGREPPLLQGEQLAVKTVRRGQVSARGVGRRQTLEGHKAPGFRTTGFGQSQGSGKAGFRLGVTLFPKGPLCLAQRGVPSLGRVHFRPTGDKEERQTEAEIHTPP